VIQQKRSGYKQELVQRETPRRLAPFPSQAEILSLLNSSLLGQRLSAFSFRVVFWAGRKIATPSVPILKQCRVKFDQRDLRIQSSEEIQFEAVRLWAWKKGRQVRARHLDKGLGSIDKERRYLSALGGCSCARQPAELYIFKSEEHHLSLAAWFCLRNARGGCRSGGGGQQQGCPPRG